MKFFIHCVEMGLALIVASMGLGVLAEVVDAYMDYRFRTFHVVGIPAGVILVYAGIRLMSHHRKNPW